MFWVKYFSFAVKEGVKNTHCECGDEALLGSCYQFHRPCKTREQHCLFPSLPFTTPYLFTFISHSPSIVISSVAHSSSKVAAHITFLETHYSAVVTDLLHHLYWRATQIPRLWLGHPALLL